MFESRILPNNTLFPYYQLLNRWPYLASRKIKELVRINFSYFTLYVGPTLWQQLKTVHQGIRKEIKQPSQQPGLEAAR